MYAVTGATGQLGRLTVQALLKTVPADQIVAAVRDPAKAADLAAQGVVVREADYDRPETLPGAFNGVDKLLIISGTDVGRRTPQHRAAIEAAAKAGAGLVAYTSVLRADVSKLGVADEHRQAEAILTASGAPWVLLRNGWYTENYTGWIPSAVQTGALLRRRRRTDLRGDACRLRGRCGRRPHQQRRTGRTHLRIGRGRRLHHGRARRRDRPAGRRPGGLPGHA